MKEKNKDTKKWGFLEPFLDKGNYFVEIWLVFISIFLNIGNKFCNENNLDILLLFLILFTVSYLWGVSLMKTEKSEKAEKKYRRINLFMFLLWNVLCGISIIMYFMINNLN